MAKILISQNGITRSQAQNANKIKLTYYKPFLVGNIVDGTINLDPTPCTDGLDFTCPENSQYIGAI